MRNRQGQLICSRHHCHRPILDERKAYRKGQAYYCEACYIAEFQRGRREHLARLEENPGPEDEEELEPELEDEDEDE